MTLTAPNGLTTTLTANRGGAYSNLSNGTLWTDTPNVGPGPVTDADFTHGFLTQVQPEGAMGHFVGYNPNGQWTLTIKNTSGVDTGLLDEWGVNIQTGYCTPTYLPVITR